MLPQQCSWKKSPTHLFLSGVNSATWAELLIEGTGSGKKDQIWNFWILGGYSQQKAQNDPDYFKICDKNQGLTNKWKLEPSLKLNWSLVPTTFPIFNELTLLLKQHTIGLIKENLDLIKQRDSLKISILKLLFDYFLTTASITTNDMVLKETDFWCYPLPFFLCTHWESEIKSRRLWSFIWVIETYFWASLSSRELREKN